MLVRPTVFLAISLLFAGCADEIAASAEPPQTAQFLLQDCNVVFFTNSGAANGGTKIPGWSNERASPIQESMTVSVHNCTKISGTDTVVEAANLIIFTRTNQDAPEECMEGSFAGEETLQAIFVDNQSLASEISQVLGFPVEFFEMNVIVDPASGSRISWANNENFLEEISPGGSSYRVNLYSELFWVNFEGNLVRWSLSYSGSDFTPHTQIGHGKIVYPQTMQESRHDWISRVDHIMGSSMSQKLASFENTDCLEAA